MSTTAQINDVITRDKGLCAIRLEGCTLFATVADHRANRGMGSSKLLDGFSCLLAACVLCNGAKEDATGAVRAELERRGVRVPKDSTNAKTAKRCRETPVEYPDGVLYWLTLDGRKVAAGQGVEF